MKIMIDLFHGISSGNKTFRDGWHAHQYQKLKVMHPDVTVDHYWRKVDEADTIFIDPGIDFVIDGEFKCFGGFTPEHYLLIKKLKTKKVYWISQNCNEQLNNVIRSFKSRDYHLKHVIGSNIDVTPANFKVQPLKLKSLIVGNAHCLCYAAIQDKIVIVNDTLEEQLVEGLQYEEAIYCLGNGEYLDDDIIEEYVKQVAALDGKICELLPFHSNPNFDNSFNKKLNALADDYMVKVIKIPNAWNSIPKMRWEANYLDKDGYVIPYEYNLVTKAFK